MEMIDAYVQEVGRRLPEKQRADIEREIRSMIEDTLEDSSREQGRPVDEDMVAEALKKLGSPAKMAASYLPPQYLIGPELYPSFLLSARIVVSVVLIMVIVVLAASLAFATQNSDVLRGVGQASAGVIGAALQALGVIVVVFAVLQRFAPEMNLPAREEAFDPRKLRLEPDPERIKPVELIVDVVFTIAALVLFNFYPQVVGFGTLKDGQWVMTGILAEGFFRLLPYLSLLWALSAIHKIAVLAQGRWTALTRWLMVGLNVLQIAMLYTMLNAGNLIGLPAAAAVTLGTGALEQLNGAMNLGLKVALTIALVVTVVVTAVWIFKLTLGKTVNLVFGKP